MLTFKYVYDSTKPDSIRDFLKEIDGYCINLESYDVNHYRQRKKAFKIKGSCSARENPFLAVYDGDKLVKAFYTEANECNILYVRKWLFSYLMEHAKKGFITITKVSGTNNTKYDSGHTESGITSQFGEGLPLHISSGDRWFNTSNVIEIDWENNRFKTKNSIYSFKFNEGPSN